jgi:hypothetical protein
MSDPSLPTGYDVSKYVPAGRRDCLLTVGFDQHQQHIPRFLVQLHYRTATGPIEWTAIARMDHNETSALGHDVYDEGLDVDVARRSQPTIHLQLAHTGIRPDETTASTRIWTPSESRFRGFSKRLSTATVPRMRLSNRSLSTAPTSGGFATGTEQPRSPNSPASTTVTERRCERPRHAMTRRTHSPSQKGRAYSPYSIQGG